MNVLGGPRDGYYIPAPDLDERKRTRVHERHFGHDDFIHVYLWESGKRRWVYQGLRDLREKGRKRNG